MWMLVVVVSQGSLHPTDLETLSFKHLRMPQYLMGLKFVLFCWWSRTADPTQPMKHIFSEIPRGADTGFHPLSSDAPPIPNHQLFGLGPPPKVVPKNKAALVVHWIMWLAHSSEVEVQAWDGKTSKRSLADTYQPIPFRCHSRFDWKANLVRLKELFLWHRLEAVSRLMCSTNVSRCILIVSALSEIVIQVFILANPGFVFMKKCCRSWTNTSPKCLRRIFSIPSCDGFILWSDRRVKQIPTTPDWGWK